MSAAIRILHFEDSPLDAELIHAQLRRSGLEVVMTVAGSREAFKAAVSAGDFDIVISDYHVPHFSGLEALEFVRSSNLDMPFILVTGALGDERAVELLRNGATDSVLKDRLARLVPAMQRALSEHTAHRQHKSIAARLADAQRLSKLAAAAARMGTWQLDVASGTLDCSDEFLTLIGMQRREWRGTAAAFDALVHPDDVELRVSSHVEAINRGGYMELEFRMRKPDGEVCWMLSRGDCSPAAVGAAIRMLGVMMDITERKRMEQALGDADRRALHGAIGRKAAEDALFAEMERAEVTLNSIGDAVLSTDISGNVTYLNLAAEKMTGWSREEAVGRPLAEVFCVVGDETRETAANPMELAVRHNQTVSLPKNSILIRRDGVESPIEDSAAPIHDRGGGVTGAVIVFHDVSDSRSMALKMAHLAQHDFLTDLPNRMLLNDRVSHSIALARRRGRQLAVLFLDLDHFKHINDSLGHPIGDQLLKAVVLRLVACVRASDTVSRQGGDEFVVLLSEIAHPQDAAFIAEKMRVAVIVPYAIAEHDLHLSISIGISIYPDDGQDAETLIKNADTAMYQAKDSGRNNVQFFRQDMNVRAVERQSVEGNLRRALERHEFVLNYQPKVNLETSAITGAEALIRWRHPDRGLVLPTQFIAIAEDCGLIVPIGQWVLREACTQARAWIDAGLKFDQMAVNISAVEFHSKGFFEAICAVLKETHLEAPYLELELTETVLMRNIESTSAVLQALNAMGVRLAVDDFGTGYSSLSYLSRFPIDTLKIDQSFVRDVTTDANDATIVSAVIAMGQSLKQRVVAEGVETSEQLAFLQSHRCDEGQGYYFSQPVPANAFTTLLETGMAKSAHH